MRERERVRETQRGKLRARKVLRLEESLPGVLQKLFGNGCKDRLLPRN